MFRTTRVGEWSVGALLLAVALTAALVTSAVEAWWPTKVAVTCECPYQDLAAADARTKACLQEANRCMALLQDCVGATQP